MIKAFECDVCGNSDYIVDNGYYVCNVCGTKILKTEYKKSRKEAQKTSFVIRSIKLILCLYLLCVIVNRIIMHYYGYFYYSCIIDQSLLDYIIAFNVWVACPAIIVLWYMFSSKMCKVVPRGRYCGIGLYTLVSLTGTNKIMSMLLTDEFCVTSSLFFVIINVAIFAIVLFVNDI